MKLSKPHSFSLEWLAVCALTCSVTVAQFPSVVTLQNPSSVERVRLDCPGYEMQFGSAIAGIGDINADGIDDFAICAPFLSPSGLSSAGACFVYFGGAWTASTAILDASALNGTNGFVVQGEQANDVVGAAVRGAGDVNGDGIADLLVLGPEINNAAGSSTGSALVLFGAPGIGSSGTITPSMINGSNGFRVIGPTVPPEMPGGGYVGAGAAIGDVNHDGFADIAFGGAYGMHASTLTLLSGFSRGITAADFDGNGLTDLVVSHQTQNKFTLFRNQGGGIFSPLSFNSHTLPRKVMSADVDNDGDLDLVFVTQQTAAPNQMRITVVKNIASGLFGAGTDYLLNGAANADFDLGDLDGDSFVDIVAVSYTNPTGAPRELETLINNQSGGFTYLPTLETPNSPHHVRLGDLDGDGDLDAAVFQFNPKRLKFYSNDGAGTLTPVGTGAGMLLANPGYIGGFELADLDGDGDLDVLGSSSVAEVLRNDGSFAFTVISQVDMQNTPLAPLLYDFDADGDLDAWIGGANMDDSRPFAVLPNRGDGTLDSPRRFAAPISTATKGVLIDFDGDGRLDVACLGDSGNQSTVVLLHSNGDCTFDGAYRGRAWVVYGAASFAAPGDVLLDGLTGPDGFHLDGRASNEGFGGRINGAGDIDADGIDDFALGSGGAWVGGATSGAVFVVRGATGLGASGVLDVYNATPASVFVIDDAAVNTSFPATIGDPGDLDGDGINDLAVGAIVSPGGLGIGGIYVVFGAAGLGTSGPISLANTDGIVALKFEEPYSSVGVGGSATMGMDINADGRRDLIAGGTHWPLNGFSQDHGQTYVLYGRARPYPSGVIVSTTLDGTNGFTLEGDLQSGAYFGTTVAAAGDVDNDGVEDLLVGEPGWDQFASGASSGRAWLVLGGKYLTPQTYCTSKTNSLGCVPSIGWTGALPSVTDPDSFIINSTNTINQRNGLLFYSVAGRAGAPFLGGTLCVLTPLRRTPISSSGGNAGPDDCSGIFSFDWGSWMSSGADPGLIAGTTADAQFWSRDPQSSFAVNLTDALEFTIGP